MKKVARIAAQGDVIIRRVDRVPAGARDASSEIENGRVIVGHSETGHHHVASGPVQKYFHTDDPLVSYVVANGPMTVRHERDFDTHEEVLFDAGMPSPGVPAITPGAGEPVVWEIIRQREHHPEGWRPVVD